MNAKLLQQAKDLAAKHRNIEHWGEASEEEKANLVNDVCDQYEKLLRMGKTDKQRRDYFAGLSLQAMIAKMPLIDKEGEFGTKITDESERAMKEGLAKSAWGYADWMLYTDTKDFDKL